MASLYAGELPFCNIESRELMVNLHKPGLVVFDMDSTLITIECIDEIAALAGRKPEVSAITAAAMRGEIDFGQSLLQRVAVLKDVPEKALTQLFEPIPFTVGARELVRWFQLLGWKTAVISGGFTWFAEQVQHELGLDAAVANILEVENSTLTGVVVPPIVDAQAKASHLVRLAEQWAIPANQVIAVGDGANDIPMLQAAGCGVAFHAKPTLYPYADMIVKPADLMVLKHQLVERFG
ncbi:MAG: phosphoserine phosphatase SerB [Idiomarina sp.]